MNQLVIVAGKLISSIQKEWNDEAGFDCAAESEDVLYRSHDILAACKGSSLDSLLASKSLREYLGESWIECHPRVESLLIEFEHAFDVRTIK